MRNCAAARNTSGRDASTATRSSLATAPKHRTPSAVGAGHRSPPIISSFPYLFEVKPKAEPGDRVVTLPPSFAPAQGVVVARPAALDLVSYLVSLDHTYPLAPSDTGP